MTVELGRRLVASGAVTPAQLQAALFEAARSGIPLLKALLDIGAVSIATLEQEVERSDLPTLNSFSTAADALSALPEGLCHRLLALPVRIDARTGTVDVVVADPFDLHIQQEFAFHLQSPVRIVRAPIAAIDDALRRLPRSLPNSPPAEVTPSTVPFSKPLRAHRSVRPTPAFGSPIPPVMPPRPSDAPIPLVRRAASPKGSSLPIVSASSRSPSDSPEPFALEPRAQTKQRVPSIAVPAPPRVPIMTRPPQLTSDAPSSPGAFLDALRIASSRDEVIDQLLLGMQTVAERVAIFAVRRSCFVGWSCNDLFAPLASLRDLIVPTNEPSVLATAADVGWYLGPLPDTGANRQLALLANAHDEISLVAVMVLGKPALIVMACGFVDTMTTTRIADALAREASAALARLVRADKPSR